jgi:hypothetical protein
MNRIVSRGIGVFALVGLAVIALAQNPDAPGQRRRPQPGFQGQPTVTGTPPTATATVTAPPATPTVTGTPPAATATPVIGATTPTSTEECKNDGWRTFTNPRFKNQGDCVSFVASGGRARGNPGGTPTAVPTRTPTP